MAVINGRVRNGRILGRILGRTLGRFENSTGAIERGDQHWGRIGIDQHCCKGRDGGFVGQRMGFDHVHLLPVLLAQHGVFSAVQCLDKFLFPKLQKYF